MPSIPLINMEISRLIVIEDMTEANPLLENSLDVLKKLSRVPNKEIQMISLVCLFTILNDYIKIDHPYAAPTYKSIIFALLENRKNTDIRNLIISNFIVTLENLPNAPLGILIEPYIAQLSQYKIESVDVDFIILLSSHPGMNENYLKIIVTELNKYLFSFPLYSPSLSISFLTLVLRFHSTFARVNNNLYHRNT